MPREMPIGAVREKKTAMITVALALNFACQGRGDICNESKHQSSITVSSFLVL